jgi:hypothetical protein
MKLGGMVPRPGGGATEGEITDIKSLPSSASSPRRELLRWRREPVREPFWNNLPLILVKLNMGWSFHLAFTHRNMFTLRPRLESHLSSKPLSHYSEEKKKECWGYSTPGVFLR